MLVFAAAHIIHIIVIIRFIAHNSARKLNVKLEMGPEAVIHRFFGYGHLGIFSIHTEKKRQFETVEAPVREVGGTV